MLSEIRRRHHTLDSPCKRVTNRFYASTGRLSRWWHRDRDEPSKSRKTKTFALELGHKLEELAIAWLLTHPWLNSVIAGATLPEQLSANIAIAEWKLITDEMEEIERNWYKVSGTLIFNKKSKRLDMYQCGASRTSMIFKANSSGTMGLPRKYKSFSKNPFSKKS
jgi:hypothetical protein